MKVVGIMPFFHAIFEPWSAPNPTISETRLGGKHIIINRKPFAERHEVIRFILEFQDYPEADHFIVEAETSRDAIQVVHSGDPDKVRLIRKGRGGG